MSAGDAVRRLVADLELPGTLAAVGADDALKSQISEYAMAHPVVLANPRPSPRRKMCMKLWHLQRKLR